jgi:hypothetical protein
MFACRRPRFRRNTRGSRPVVLWTELYRENLYKHVFIHGRFVSLVALREGEYMSKPRIAGKTIYIATILSIVTFGAGFALAAVSVTNATENASGNYQNTAAITGWSESSGKLGTIPSTLPTVGSTCTLAAPCSTGTIQSISVIASGTAASGDIAQVFVFSETASLTALTEVELTFTLNTASGSTTFSNTNIYVESPTPAAAETVTIYLDAGSAASATVTINFAEQFSQQCSAVGTCP